MPLQRDYYDATQFFFFLGCKKNWGSGFPGGRARFRALLFVGGGEAPEMSRVRVCRTPPEEDGPQGTPWGKEVLGSPSLGGAQSILRSVARPSGSWAQCLPPCMYALQPGASR